MTKDTSNSGTLFIVSASSGAGKTTLVQEVINRLKPALAIEKVITYTTKKPRAVEKHGTDYFFLSEEEFKKRIEQDFFVEHSTAYGAYYGFPRHIIADLQKGINYIAILDCAGAQAIKKEITDAILIWIETPNISSLADRLIKRAQESLQEVDFRLNLAAKERRFIEQFDIFHYKILNETLETAVDTLEQIIRTEVAELLVDTI